MLDDFVWCITYIEDKLDEQWHKYETVKDTEADDNKHDFEEYDKAVARCIEHAHDAEEGGEGAL